MAHHDASLCEKFAKIIGGQGGFAGGKCVATIVRDKLKVKILGKRFIVTTSFSFESRDKETGRALCLGRVALLQEEVTKFTRAISKQKIIISSQHNEWLFDNPNLIYVNIEAVEKPLVFAKKVREALEAIDD
jgi:predicted homoserine dehydrogenase-like protein